MYIWTAASKHVNKSSSDTFDSSFIPQYLKEFGFLTAPLSHSISKSLDGAKQACRQEHDHLQICVD